MKNYILKLTVLTTLLTSFAATMARADYYDLDCKKFEAQVIAKIVSISHLSQPGFTKYCFVHVQFDDAKKTFWRNDACPLEKDEVLANGILVTKSPTSGLCPYNVGDELSGVVYRNATGASTIIYLE